MKHVNNPTIRIIYLKLRLDNKNNDKEILFYPVNNLQNKKIIIIKKENKKENKN
jgi:hypothetical protein